MSAGRIVRVEAVLAAAREGLARVTPHQAAELARRGGLVVDTRPEADRRASGVIAGAVVVERNVLEWRLDPSSPDRIPEADSDDRPVVVFCNDGYASSLAAVSLAELGLSAATDMIGGFNAWAAAGLPIERMADQPVSGVPSLARPR